MDLSLGLAIGLWLVPVWLAFVGPRGRGWRRTASALLLPAALGMLLGAFLVLDSGRMAIGGFGALVITLVALLTRGGGQGQVVALLLATALAPALLYIGVLLYLAWGLRGWQ